MAESGLCTRCGATLPEADALGLITCPGCGDVTKLAGSTPTLDPDPDPSPGLQGWPAPPVAAPPPGNQWAQPAAVAGAPPSTPPPSSRGRSSASSSGGGKVARRIGCAVVPLAVAMVILFAVIGAVRSCDISTVTDGFDGTGFDTSVLTLSGSATVLPTQGDGTDVIVVQQETEDSQTTRSVARLRFQQDTSKLVWKSEPLDEDTYRVEVAQVDDTLFAATEDQLYALDADTGETRWTTTLHDKLTAGCPNCFGAVGGRLVVRTTDAYVTAYGTRSGEPQWSKRLSSTSGSMSIVGDRLFLVDEPESSSTPTPVLLVDPANGKTMRSTSPQCPKGQDTPWDLSMSAGDVVRPVPGSSDVMAAFGFGDSCVVRWDPATSTIRWTSRLNGFGSLDQDEIVVGERDLVLGSPGEALVTVYLPNGKARVLPVPADLQAQPSQIVGRTLVALTVTTRGTPKGGMAAWDLSTGERTWANASLGTAQPVSSGRYHSSDALFDGTPRSLLVPVGDGLNVFVFEGTDRTFSVSPVDLGTGDLGTTVRRGFLTRYDSGTPSLTIEGQTTDHLLVSLDNLLQSIPASGKGPVVSYPERN